MDNNEQLCNPGTRCSREKHGKIEFSLMCRDYLRSIWKLNCNWAGYRALINHGGGGPRWSDFRNNQNQQLCDRGQVSIADKPGLLKYYPIS